MASVFPQLVDDLRALIVATWPDVLPGAVWEVEDIKLVAWDDVTPPVGVLEIPNMPLSDEWGVGNDVHEGEVTLYYIGATEGDSSLQRTRAETMRDTLRTATLSTGQVLEVTSIDWTDDLPLNLTFAQKGYMQRACAVRVDVLVFARLAA